MSIRGVFQKHKKNLTNCNILNDSVDVPLLIYNIQQQEFQIWTSKLKWYDVFFITQEVCFVIDQPAASNETEEKVKHIQIVLRGLYMVTISCLIPLYSIGCNRKLVKCTWTVSH